MTDLEALKANLRDDAHMTQRDGLGAMLATAEGAADAIERLEAENAAMREAGVAKIVAWLRGGAGIGATLAHPSVIQAIEAGEYRNG